MPSASSTREAGQPLQGTLALDGRGETGPADASTIPREVAEASERSQRAVARWTRDWQGLGRMTRFVVWQALRIQQQEALIRGLLDELHQLKTPGAQDDGPWPPKRRRRKR